VPIAWFGGSEDELAAIAVGASLLLTTPLDADEVVAHVRALVEADASAARERHEAALGHWRALELDQAVSEFQAAAGAAPGSLLGAWSQYLSGAARLERGEHQVAAEELQALLDERPAFWRAHAQLSRLYRLAGFQWEADDHLRQARELNPALPEDPHFEPHPIPEFAVPAGSGEEIELVVDEAAVAEPEVEDDDGRPLVLLADDSELALAMISDHLGTAGYRVVTALDGEEALEKARRRRPDLVVLDGLMPGKNGFETCRALKEEVFAGDPPPVLILSAIYTKRKQVHEAVSVFGADDLIAKSTDDAALIEAATRLCPPDRA
jgi:DNA-binding response OmpR family regulator